MLESIAATLLTKYLGDYVEGLDANNLKLNLSAGDAVLTNLKLKKSALETLELPITIKNGYLSKLTLQIPWSSLGSKAAIIRIDGVYLVAGPKTRTKSTAEEEKVRKQQLKQQRLQLAELLGLDKPDQRTFSSSQDHLLGTIQKSGKDDDKEKNKKKDDGFFSRMAMKVVDNVQIFLDNIHIRYEDDVSNPQSPFAFGITLDCLHAQSCNGSWEPAFLTVGEDVIHKLVTLKNLAIYWNTTPEGNAKFVPCDNAAEMSALLQKLIPSHSSSDAAPGNEPDHHYILKPISGLLKATLDRGDLVLSRPRLQLDAELQQILFALNSSQFQRAQDLLEHFSLYVRSLEYMEYRPPVDVRPTDDPKLWWKFVLRSVRESVAKRNRSWTWEYMQARSNDRKQYMALYEKKLSVSLAKMSTDEKIALESLEARLEYTDIITFRQLANASLAKKQNEQKEKKKKEGWFGGWFGGSSSDSPKDDKTKEADEEAAMKEIYSAIGFSADQVEKETVFPKDYVKTAVNFKMESCAFQLRQDDVLDQPQQQQQLQLQDKHISPVFLSFDQRGFDVSLLMRDGSMSVVASLETVKMSDFHTLEGKELTMLEPDFGLSRSSSPAPIQDLSDGTMASTSTKKFVNINFDMNPLDAPNIDMRVGLKVQPIQSTLSRALIDRIVQFFERKTTRAQLVELSSAAASTWEDLRNRAQTSLKYTIEKRSKIKIDVELAAPRFTIPKNFSDVYCPALVLDLGTISLKSDPDARSRAVTGSNTDASVSEDYFYDRFDVSMTGLHAMVVGGQEAPWANSKSIDPTKYVIINKFDLDIILKVCSAPSPDLPQLKIQGSLKRLAVDVTDYRITWILDVLEAVGKSTIPPRELSEEERAALKLLMAARKKEEARKEKLASEKSTIESALAKALPDSSSASGEIIPTAHMAHRAARKRHVAQIADAPGTPVKSRDEDYHPAETTASPASPQDPQSALPSSSSPSSIANDTTFLQKRLEVDFTLGELAVTLHKSVPVVQEANSPLSAPPTTPLIMLALKNLSVEFNQTNQWMTVGIRLGAFLIEDRFTPGAPNLIESGTQISGISASQTIDLVQLNYRNTPRDSIAFDKIEHDVKATFGTLKINLNRVTIACLMQVGNDFTNSLKQNQLQAQASQQGSKEEVKEEVNEEVEQQQEQQEREEAEKKPERRTDVSLAQLDISLGALIVCLQKENIPFMQFDIARSHVSVDVRDDGVLHVNGFLGGISLVNCNPGLEWGHMISISGDKILHFSFSKYNRESVTYPGFDMSVMAQMSSLKAVFLNSAVQELLVYFGAFEKMRKAIEVTTSYYYNASLDAVRSAAESATKIRIQVVVQNPTIIVPYSSKDSRHILLDLGKITVRNSWESTPTGVELDVMEASISGLNMRSLTDPNASEFVKNIRVINDSNVSAIFKRPLSGNQNNTSPNIDLTANIENIDLSFTEDHLTLVFGILSDNLGEKPARPDQVELDKIVEFLSSFSYTMAGWEAAKTSLTEDLSERKPSPSATFLAMQVKAALKQVSLTVYKESGQNPNTLKSTSLATFAIQQLAANYTQYSDSRMDVDLTLGAVVLEDMREYSENKFKRIWAPNVHVDSVASRPSNIKVEASSSSQALSPSKSNVKPQFSLTYKMEPTEAFTQIKLELYKPRLYLIPGAIQDLYEFAMDNVDRMTKSLAQLKQAQETVALPETSTDSPSSTETVSIDPQASSSSVANTEDRKSNSDKKDAERPADDAKVSTMSIQILLTSPELCVVENSDRSDPVALILHLGESKLQFFMTSDGQQKLDLGVQKLDAYKCILDADHSDIAHDVIKLLQPLSLGVNMGTGADKIRRLAVEVGELQSIVSYNDIKLVIDIYQSYVPLLESFSKPRGDQSLKSIENGNSKVASSAIASLESNVKSMEEAIASAPSSPSANNSIEKDKRKKSKKDKESEEDVSEMIPLDRREQTQLMIITVHRIIVSLLNDRESPDYTTPVLEQSLDRVKIIFSTFASGAMDALITLSTLELKAYNNTLAAFEPVIEPWGLEFNFLKNNQAMGLHLASQEMMDINITKSLLDTVFGLLKLLEDFKTPEKSDGDDESSSMSSAVYSTISKQQKASKTKSKKKRVGFHPYIIRNETNVPISVRLSSGDGKRTDLAPGQDHPISLHVDREQAARKVVRPEMDITFPNNEAYLSVGKIPISRIATYSYAISRLDAQVMLVADITFEQGSKIVTFRGNRLINNETSTDMEVGILGNSSGDSNLAIFTAPANGHLSIPMDMTNYRALKFRPKGSNNLKWFEWSRGDKELDQSSKLAKQRNGKGAAHNLRDQGSRFSLFMCPDDLKDYVWVCRAKEVSRSVEGDSSARDFVTTLSPALTLENATCASLSTMVVNIDAGETHVIAPHEMERAEEKEQYQFDGLGQLSTSGLGGLALSVKLPGFSWSTPVRFAEHARWVPLRGSAKKLSEPLKLILGDESEHIRPLELLADVKVDDTGSCHMTVYSNYWLINQSGLNLFYKANDSSKETESAGQRIHSPAPNPDQPVLSGDPSGWYDTIDGLVTTDYVYAQNRFFYGSPKLSIKVEDSAWSEAFPLGMQNEGMITIKDKNHTGRQYEFGVKVKPAPGRFWRTKLVRIYPGFILVNKSSRVLRYRQEGQHGPPFRLETGQQLPFHWPVLEDAKKEGSPTHSKLLVCTDDQQDSWSPPFALDVAGSFQVRLRNEFSESDEETTLDVIIKPMEGTTFIVFGDQTDGNGVSVVSYELQNRSPYSVIIGQKNSTFSSTLDPGKVVPFCWDIPQVQEPMLTVKLALDPSKKTPAELSLDVIAKYPELPGYVASDGTKLAFEVQAQGPKKVLIITSTAPLGSSSNTVISAATIASSSSAIALDAAETGSNTEALTSSPDRVVHMNLKVSLKGVGVSVVDTTPQELLYFTLQSIYADVQASNVDQSVEVKIGMAQLDNQLYLSPLPIALYSTPNPSKPFFHASLVRDQNIPAVQFFKYFALQLQEIDLAIHEVFLYRLLSFSKFLTDYLYAKSEEEALQKLLAQTDSEIPKIKDEDLSSSDMYYFELFHLNPIKVLVTFMTSMDLDASATDQQEESGDPSGLAEILGYVGILTDIERAPIELNALMLQNPFCSRKDLMDRITKHYTLAGLKQAYKIVGSADFLGNPVSLVSNLGTGVKDFFYEPAMGIVESPAAFGKGLAKGTKSLVLKTTYAIFDTASKLTGTVAKVGAKLTMDDDYQRERAIRNQTKARHAGEGLVYGARDFGIGLYKGITGVVLEPIRGGQQEGAVGVFKGIGKGLAGIVLKPVVGAVDLVTRTTEGIKNTTTYMDEKSKAPIRPPRYFGADNLVRIYDYEKAAGQLVLRTLDERRGRRDIYESHIILKDELAIISRRHIFLLEQDKLHFGFKWQLDWKEKFSNLTVAVVVYPASESASSSTQSTSKSSPSNTRDLNFSGIVLLSNPTNQEPRSRKIPCDQKQAAIIAKKLSSFGVVVKRASNLTEIVRPPPIITGVPINMEVNALDSSTEAALAKETEITEFVSHTPPSDGVLDGHISGQVGYTRLPTSDPGTSSLGSSSSSIKHSGEIFRVHNKKVEKFAGLADWIDEDEEEDSMSERYDSFTIKKKRQRKQKASETTALLGDRDNAEEGCCGCSCAVM